jgi:hypothetical protein
MAKQEEQKEYRVHYYAPEIDEEHASKPRKPVSKEEYERIKKERQKELDEQLKLLSEHKQALTKWLTELSKLMRNKDYSINPFRCGASNNLKQLDQLDL